MKEPHYPTGVAASLMAEVGFLFLAVAAMWLQGKSPWMPPRMPATLIVGPRALHPPGFVPHNIVLGLLMHLWLAVLVGGLYAALRPRLRVPRGGGTYHRRDPVRAGLLGAPGSLPRVARTVPASPGRKNPSGASARALRPPFRMGVPRCAGNSFVRRGALSHEAPPTRGPASPVA